MAGPTAEGGADRLLLVGCTIVDCVRDEPIEGTSLLIEGGRITEIGRGTRPDPSWRVVDLEGGYVLPGLWDSHCHLSLMIPDPTNHSRFDSEGEATIRAGHNAMDALRVGFTSLRVVGEVNGIDMAWRAAFRSGMFRGPRLSCAGNLLGSTGGHLRQHRLRPVRLEQLTSTFDGPSEAMKLVREQVHRGADLIKIAITGGMSLHEAMDDPQVEVDEIRAAVTAARSRRRRVAAHASGGEVTKEALRIGIDSVEHGYVLDEECVELMARHGTTYVPTIGVTHDPDFARRHHWSDAITAKAAEAAPAHRAALEMARHHGVRICAGGDKYPIADSGIREIELLGQLGLTNLEALQAATCNAAWLSGHDADLGTVEVGKVADLLVTRANPLEDLGAIREVAVVLKGGSVVVDHLGAGLIDDPVGAGVSELGVPLPPLPPQPTERLCC